MPIPVPIPSGPLAVTDADTARAENVVATLAQLLEFGASGGTPSLRTPPSYLPTTDPTSARPTLVLDSAPKQLHYRSWALALVKSAVALANSSTFGVTELSSNPSVLSHPVALNAEEVSTSPLPNKVPRAGPDGTLDPAWIPGSGFVPDFGSFSSTTFGVFNGTCQTTDLVGNAVRLTGSSARNVVTANPSSSSTMPAVGIIISKPTSTTCVVQGIGVAVGIFSGLVVGKRYWIGSSGTLIATPPVGAPGTHLYAQSMGLAVSSTDLFLTGDQNIFGFYR